MTKGSKEGIQLNLNCFVMNKQYSKKQLVWILLIF